jgi:accessory gene regulator B
MDDYTNCMLTSFAMFIGFGLISKYTYLYWSPLTLLILSLSVFAAALFVSVKYVPADTVFKPMNNMDQNRKLKKLAIAIVFLWLVLDAFLIIKGYKFLVLAGCLGMLMSSFIISPAGYKFFDFISGRMIILRIHPSTR